MWLYLPCLITCTCFAIYLLCAFWVVLDFAVICLVGLSCLVFCFSCFCLLLFVCVLFVVSFACVLGLLLLCLVCCGLCSLRCTVLFMLDLFAPDSVLWCWLWWLLWFNVSWLVVVVWCCGLFASWFSLVVIVLFACLVFDSTLLWVFSAFYLVFVLVWCCCLVI